MHFHHNLAFSDEPGKPGTPEFVDWDNMSVDLKWAPPATDGGSPITKYIIEKKEKFCMNWEKATEVLGDKTEVKVMDLKEKSEYQFRVIAVNAAGPSEPSDATKHHLVKHRKCKFIFFSLLLLLKYEIIFKCT